MRNGYRTQSNLNRTQSNQSNAIESIERNRISIEPIEHNRISIEFQSNLKIGVIFDWDSIACDNRISTVRSRSIAFNWFDRRTRSIDIVWLLLVGDLIVQFLRKLSVRNFFVLKRAIRLFLQPRYVTKILVQLARLIIHTYVHTRVFRWL